MGCNKMKLNSRTNIPKIATITFVPDTEENEQARIRRIEDILTTMMADYAYAKAKGKV